MRVLFLSRWLPFPPDNGSKIRILNLLRSLAEIAEIDLITLYDQSEPPGELGELGSLCRDISLFRRKPYRAFSLQSIIGLFSPTPRWIIGTHQDDLEEVIKERVEGSSYDLVIASQWEMACYWKAFENKSSIFEEIELGQFLSKRDQASNLLTTARHSLTLFKLKRYIRKVLPTFSASTVASDIEAEHIQRILPDYSELFRIPNCIRPMDYDDVEFVKQDNTIIFTGSMNFRPNYAAMKWFIKSIYPLILEAVPDAQLLITGGGKDRDLPDAKNLRRLGHVPDVRPYLTSATVAVVPLLHGGGTRLKILEAMALNTPVIATTKGAEGLEVTDGQEILIADEPDHFASQVVSVLRNPELGDKLAGHAYSYVSTYASCQETNLAFVNLCRSLVP